MLQPFPIGIRDADRLGQPSTDLRSARFVLALQVQSQLLPEEQVLGGQGEMGPETEPDKPEGIQA